MATRIPWSEQEAALLLHALIEVLQNKIDRKTAISMVSKELRKLAVRNGLDIDEKFRNENGITLQMSHLEYAFTAGTSGLPVKGGWFYDIVELYKNRPDQFNSLLKEALGMNAIPDTTEQDQYFNWLSARVSPAQLSELYLVYAEIDEYFVGRKILKSSLLQTSDLNVLSKVRDTINGNKFFRMTHRRNAIKMSAAIKHYIDYVKENQSLSAKAAVEEEKNPDASISRIEDDSRSDSATDGNITMTLPTADVGASVAAVRMDEVPDIIKVLQEKGIAFTDNRSKGGCLWVYGGSELKPIIKECESTGLKFHYKPYGTRSSYGEPCWWAREDSEDNQTSDQQEEKLKPFSEETADVIETVDLSVERSYAFSTPISFSYFGDETTVASWRELYTRSIGILLDDYPSVIQGLKGTAIIGRGGMDVSNFSSSALMLSPRKIASDLYVEVNYSATDLMKRLRKLIVLCNMDFDNFKISFRRLKPTERVPAKRKQEPTATESTRQSSGVVISPENDSFPSSRDVNSPAVLEEPGTPLQTELSYRDKFEAWLVNNKIPQGSARTYADSLTQIGDYLVRTQREDKHIFTILETERLEKICMDIVGCEDMAKKEGAAKFALYLYALRKYIRFSKECMAAPEKDMPNERYLAILRENFENGFRINSMIDRNRFKQFYYDRYKEDVQQNDEELVGTIRGMGIVQDGRVFIRTGKEQNNLLDEIRSVIVDEFDHGASCIYVSSVFERYQQPLASQLSIYSEDILKEQLMRISRGEYNAGKQYLYTQKKKPDASADIKRFMVQSQLPVNYDQIHEVLWYIPIDLIKHSLVVTEGIVNVAQETYFYAANLPVSTIELEQIVQLIHAQLNQRSFITGDELRTLIQNNCPSVAINTEGFCTWGLRNVLGFLLRDRFSFKGAIISEMGHDINMAQVFDEFCESRDELSFDELREFAKEMKTSIYWESVFHKMLRVSQNEFVKKSAIHFDIQAIDATLDHLIDGDYIAINKITLFFHFPSLSVQWNEFVLESYAGQLSKEFTLLHASYTSTECCGAIVRKQSKIKDFKGLVIDVLANEQGWKSQADALALLVSKGYLQRKRYSEIEPAVSEARVLRDRNGKKEREKIGWTQ